MFHATCSTKQASQRKCYQINKCNQCFLDQVAAILYVCNCFEFNNNQSQLSQWIIFHPCESDMFVNQSTRHSFFKLSSPLPKKSLFNSQLLLKYLLCVTEHILAAWTVLSQNAMSMYVHTHTHTHTHTHRCTFTNSMCFSLTATVLTKN